MLRKVLDAWLEIWTFDQFALHRRGALVKRMQSSVLLETVKRSTPAAHASDRSSPIKDQL